MTSEPRDADGRIASPCVSLCALGEDDVCRGCGRRREEIRQWRAADDARRVEIRVLARQRQRG